MEKGLTNSSIIEIISAHNGASLFNDEGIAIEYEFLAKNIKTIGKQLSSIDIKNNKICALVLPNGIGMAISFLALANYVTVSPLNPSYTREEFLFFLEDFISCWPILPIQPEIAKLIFFIWLILTFFERLVFSFSRNLLPFEKIF